MGAGNGTTVAERAADAPRWRLTSLDQFRGYTVAGMFLVNYLGSFAVTPEVLKHHNTYCSYADTIMPQFLFAVGFAFRLTFGRRVARDGARTAYWRATRRIAGLVVLSLVLYTLGDIGPTWHRLTEGDAWAALGELFKRQWFQTLLHIAVTSLWILPVIRSGAAVRAAFLLASAAGHLALSAWFNFAWVNTSPNGIDGGPLGFLTWTIPAMVGTFACDAVVRKDGGPRSATMWGWAFALMLVGYVMSCGTRLYDTDRYGVPEFPPPSKLAASPLLPPRAAFVERLFPRQYLAEPPFVPPPRQRQWNYWMMSQRSGSVSYLTFAAGFSLAVFVMFYLACDRHGWQIGVFRTLGTNALAGYVLHGALEEAVKPWIPRDAGWWHVAAGFGITFGVTFLVLWLMERKKIFIRM
jgi:predicted acyltransferase